MNGVKVSGWLVIPHAELEIGFTTSGGPGGQHANRSSTKVDLSWNVDASTVLTEQQRNRIRSRLKNRIDSAGNLRLSASSSRSQLRNREEVERRLAKLVAGALRAPRSRVATRPTKAATERRLEGKRRRSDVKRARKKPDF